MKYYLVTSYIHQGEFEYEQHYFIASPKELPEDIDHQLTVWNWHGVSDRWRKEDGWTGFVSDDRKVVDCVIKEVSESTVNDLRPTMHVCTFTGGVDNDSV